MSILNSFPAGKTPRPQQVKTLLEIERIWDEADCIVVDLPVASGKSLIAQTIARWALKQHRKMSRVLAPTNLLVDQYLRDFPYLHTLPASYTFTCKNSVETAPDGTVLHSHSCMKEKTRRERAYCSGCPYVRAKKAGYMKPYGVYNYYTYTANKYYRPVLIVDEAHNLLPTLRELNAKKYWHRDYGYPTSTSTYAQLFRWVEGARNRFAVGSNQRLKLEFLHKELIANRTRFIVDRGVENLRGEPEDCIKLLPVNVRDFGHIFWPAKKVEKVILMSATISRKDIESLGLDKKRVVFIDAPSAIPAEQRPIYIDGSINLSHKHQAGNLGNVLDWIRQKLKEKSTKGIVHLTYALAAMLRPHLLDSRLLWHTKENKMDVYKQFLNAPEGAVLMACGLYEGIDLPDELGRWQALLKIPFPSLESPAIAYLAETDEEWYANETIKVVAQMSGRIARHEKDWGETFILDTSFKKLYDDWSNLFPAWFKDAIVWSKDVRDV